MLASHYGRGVGLWGMGARTLRNRMLAHLLLLLLRTFPLSAACLPLALLRVRAAHGHPWARWQQRGVQWCPQLTCCDVMTSLPPGAAPAGTTEWQLGRRGARCVRCDR